MAKWSLTEMIKEADTDGDGVISFTEFATIMARSDYDFLDLSLCLPYNIFIHFIQVVEYSWFFLLNESY